MREILKTLEIIVITSIVTLSLFSCFLFYCFTIYIQKDPIYKKAYDIVKEKDILNENN